jgi:glycosyltransferase involved in cell wall biosynthesis
VENVNLKDLSVVFAGCVKNCSKFLPKSLENLKSYSTIFKKSFTIIVENGSKDETRKILKDKQSSDDFFLFEDDLNQLPSRGQRLEKARNLIIEKIRNTPTLNSCDLFIVLDLDDMGNYKIDKKDISNSVDFIFSNEDVGAVFANQLGGYYDMWTLRDKKYCQNDIYAEVLKYISAEQSPLDKIKSNSLIGAKEKILDQMIYSFDRDLSPILVDSAFGGFGIYKMKYVLNNKNKYKGTQKVDLIFKNGIKKEINFQRCEHVNFNLGLIDQNLKLYILPNLINGEFQNLCFLPQVAFDLIIKKM